MIDSDHVWTFVSTLFLMFKLISKCTKQIIRSVNFYLTADDGHLREINWVLRTQVLFIILIYLIASFFKYSFCVT